MTIKISEIPFPVQEVIHEVIGKKKSKRKELNSDEVVERVIEEKKLEIPPEREKFIKNFVKEYLDRFSQFEERRADFIQEFLNRNKVQ